jgi:hypothetical protein
VLDPGGERLITFQERLRRGVKRVSSLRNIR